MRITMGKKLTLIVSTTLAITLVLSGAALYSISRMRQSYDEAVDRTARKITLAGRLDALTGDLSTATLEYMMYTMTQAPDRASAAQRTFSEKMAQMEQGLAEFRTLIERDEGRRLAPEIESGMATWKAAFGDLTAAVAATKLDEALKISNQRTRPVQEYLNQRTQAILALEQKTLSEQKEQLAALQAKMTWATILLILMSVVVGVLSLVVVLRASANLRKIATDLFRNADLVANGSRQVSKASQSLAQSSSEQAASLEETSASTEEINSMTQKNAENARLAADQTGAADAVLKEAGQRLDGMIVSMRDINTSSEKISKIIKVIDEIAFQTNILALNAAVEAARAGEAGMGFAVVADEVRNLAQRCAQAAKDTAELIEESITRSNEGKVKLDQVVESIGRVVKAAAEIKILANEVHVSSQEQARGIEQIAKSVGQMQQVTQSTAANAEESASAGDQMSLQAHQLHDAVRMLRDVVGQDDDGANRDAEFRTSGKPGTGAAKGLAKPGAAPPRGTGPRRSVTTLPAKPLLPLDDDFHDF